jgi:HPt (histidine-containing phosphotransfer) domain-containing protein
MRDILSVLIEDSARQQRFIEAAFRERNAARVARLAHYSAKACANLGAEGAAEALHMVELHAASAEWTECESALREVQARLCLLRSELVDLK